MFLSAVTSADQGTQDKYLVWDSFTDTDDTYLNDHTIAPINKESVSWGNYLNGLVIMSNAVAPPASATDVTHVNYVQLTPTDAHVSCLVTSLYESASVLAYNGVIIKCSGYNDYISAMLDPDKGELWLGYVSGGTTQVSTTVAVPEIAQTGGVQCLVTGWNVGDTFYGQVEVGGNTYSCSPITATGWSSNTNRGLYYQGVGAATTRQPMDDFKVW